MVDHCDRFVCYFVTSPAPSTDDDESKESTATASRLKRRSRDKRRSTGITPEQSVEDDSVSHI